MAEELSGVTAVIFIACGVLTCLLLFIFAKRQIMRFAIRARRGPHVPIGHDAKKSLRLEIERRIDLIPRIVYEPTLLSDKGYENMKPPSYYRLLAVDDVKLLERELGIPRHPTDSLRSTLIAVFCNVSEQSGTGQKIIHQFCDLYEHARHGAMDFGEVEYQAYSTLLNKLLEMASINRSSHKSSPVRTPVKRCRPTYVEKTEDTKHETTV